MRVIGVDPDSHKHGVAIYENGTLVSLHSWDIGEWLNQLNNTQIDFVSMENVLANKPTFRKRGDNSAAKREKISQDVGRCKQAQMELMRVLDYYHVPYQLVQPSGANWADNRLMFEKATKWKGNSNADTRSAAFFGFLGATAKKVNA